MNIRDIKWFDKNKIKHGILTKYGDIDSNAIDYFLSNISLSYDNIIKCINQKEKQKEIENLKSNIMITSFIYIHCIKHLSDIRTNLDKYEQDIAILYNEGKTDGNFEIINLKHRIFNLPINYQNTILKIKNSKEYKNTILKNIINNVDIKFDNKKNDNNNFETEVQTNTDIESEKKKESHETNRKEKLRKILSNYQMNGSTLDNIEKYGVTFRPNSTGHSSKTK